MIVVVLAGLIWSFEQSFQLLHDPEGWYLWAGDHIGDGFESGTVSYRTEMLYSVASLQFLITLSQAKPGQAVESGPALVT